MSVDRHASSKNALASSGSSPAQWAAKIDSDPFTKTCCKPRNYIDTIGLLFKHGVIEWSIHRGPEQIAYVLRGTPLCFTSMPGAELCHIQL
ncbi:hypothetical protein CY34DRAFT_141677 [Suillus luteus UH-Slu-Lm8-n1]|uniref:Uncharacterized protein n=1 Tax=Suillus luteus UH-Slu-Lm8-n1 TaxID=930992 RepID=A0A0D0B7V4_9AGAM|nr:hypothetical protein CY34DRAFT_141677 [Suillus luteus UH-Slu-Lm8-n1]